MLDYVDIVEDWSEADLAAREGIEITSKGLSNSVDKYCQMARIHIRQGKLNDARHLYSDAQQIANAETNPWNELILLRVERDMAKAEGEWQIAFEAARNFSEKMDEIGIHWYLALSLVEWAEIHLARGEALDYQRAGDLYHKARGLFLKMETDFYVELIDERMKSLHAHRE